MDETDLSNKDPSSNVTAEVLQFDPGSSGHSSAPPLLAVQRSAASAASMPKAAAARMHHALLRRACTNLADGPPLPAAAFSSCTSNEGGVSRRASCSSMHHAWGPAGATNETASGEQKGTTV